MKKLYLLTSCALLVLSCLSTSAQPWTFDATTGAIKAHSNVTSISLGNVLLRPNDGDVTTLDFRAKDYMELHCTGINGPSILMFKNISDLYPQFSGDMSLWTNRVARITLKKNGNIHFGDNSSDPIVLKFNTTTFGGLYCGEKGSAIIMGPKDGLYNGGILFNSSNKLDSPAIESDDIAYAFEVKNFRDTTAVDTLSHLSIRKGGKIVIGARLNSQRRQSKEVIPDGYKLIVQQGILTEKLKIANSSDLLNWSDFVFEKDYELMPLPQLEAYISKNKHLPEIPSAEEIRQNGIDVAQIEAKLLQKIEELTLYIIQQQKELDEVKKELKNKQ